MVNTYSHESKELEDLPPSARRVHQYLIIKGKAKARELAQSLEIPFRTVRYALKELERKGLITKVPDLMDLRSYFYLPKNGG